MQWIYKQVLLPGLTYGCHVWGHTLTQKQKHLLRSVERLALAYYAPMWKTTPTASLQIILNQLPSHLEVASVSIKSYIRFKNLFQHNFWDGVPGNKRMHSHLKTLKFNSNQIIHEGTPLDNFENNFMKEASFSWNPPIHSTLTAVGKNDIDDQLKIDDLVKLTQIDDSNAEAQTAAGSGTRNLKDVSILGNGLTPSQGDAETLLSTNNKSQNDNDDSFVVDLPAAGIESMNLSDEIILANGSPSEGEDEAILSNNKSQNDNDNSFVVDLPAAGIESMNLLDEIILANGSPGDGDDKAILSNNNTTLSEDEIIQGSASPQNLWILSGISKITELTLDLFKNNYKLFAQKLVDVETDLVIRAILLKNNEVIFNYSFKIQGTDNVHDATIAAANKVCNLFLGFHPQR